MKGEVTIVLECLL